MQLSRLTTLSLIYNLKEYLHTKGVATDATLSGFPYVPVKAKDQVYGDLEVPCIVVYPASTTDRELQIGGGFWIRSLFMFDIYADTEGKLLDLADMLREFVEADSRVLRYDLYPPAYQVLDGLIRTTYSSGSPEEVCQLMFENRQVTFTGRVDVIGEANAHAAQLTTIVSVPTQ